MRFTVQDWSAWAPGRETRAAWYAWAGLTVSGPPRAKDAPAALPMMLRRRLTGTGQRVVHSALHCLPGESSPRFVLATRDGELPRTVNILTAIAENTLPSPTDFSLSVHHSLVGLLSIHTANRSGHTAVSAGEDTFGFGLLEAIACVAENPDEPVLLLFADEPLPAEYAAFRDSDGESGMLALALLLGAPAPGEPALDFSAAGKAKPGRGSSAHLDFMRFLLSGMAEAISEGMAMTWRWRRAAC